MGIREVCFLVFLCSCSPKYEVVEEVHPGTFHTVSVKGHYVILYKSNEPLKEGQIIRIPNRLK